MLHKCETNKKILYNSERLITLFLVWDTDCVVRLTVTPLQTKLDSDKRTEKDIHFIAQTGLLMLCINDKISDFRCHSTCSLKHTPPVICTHTHTHTHCDTHTLLTRYATVKHRPTQTARQEDNQTNSDGAGGGGREKSGINSKRSLNVFHSNMWTPCLFVFWPLLRIFAQLVFRSLCVLVCWCLLFFFFKSKRLLSSSGFVVKLQWGAVWFIYQCIRYTPRENTRRQFAPL